MKILLTGASGAMGQESLKAILAGERNFDLLLPVMDTDKDRTIMRPYVSIPKIQIVYGNLTDPAFVTELMKGIDLVIHIAAFVSPAADYDPMKAMQVNFGSMKILSPPSTIGDRRQQPNLLALAQSHKLEIVCQGFIGGESGIPSNLLSSITTLFQRWQPNAI